MKNLHNIFKITLFAAQFSFSPIWGQGDTTKVSYSEESGTLEKQRFIDRYDYVFMTKEPTKWMVKGYGTSIGPTTFSSWKSLITAPYGAIEHKLSPSFSLQLEGKFHDPNYSGIFESTNNRLGGAGITAKNLSLTLTGEIRWYYDMAKRIRKDLSANNFSGNYWSVRYGRRFNDKTFLFNTSFGLATQNDSYVTDYFYGLSKHQVSLTYGIQRRFFRFGLIDMSINLNYLQREIVQQQIQFPGGNNRIIPNQRPDFSVLTASYETVGQEDVWFVDTKLQFGMALADFKKKFRRPACDWLKCYENQSNMIKIGWPYLSLGLKQQLVRGFVGYEQKILSSPFSLNGYLTYDFYNSFKELFSNKVNIFRGELCNLNQVFLSDIEYVYGL